MELPSGYYTIEIVKDGYITSYMEIVSVPYTGVQSTAISPELKSDEYRIVLTWGERPWDLDSHLYVTKQGEEFFINIVAECRYSFFVSNEEYLEQKDNGFTWENSAIRECSNQYLLYSMFQQEELSCICKTVVQTADNPIYGTDGGGDTADYLFLLSIEEAEKYFSSDLERRTQIVPDVELPQYDLMPYQHYLNTTDYYDWWLRSPGESSEKAACVGRFGDIMMEGQWVDTEEVSIRPAMWVDVSKVKEMGLTMAVEE